MTRIRYLGKTVKAYLKQFQDVPPPCNEGCPDCSGKLYKHGRYYRTVIIGKKLIKIPIYRRLCPACGKTLSLLPDFLYPYRVHVGGIFQKAWILRYVNGKSYYFIQNFITQSVIGGISYKTIKRWDCLWRKVKGPLVKLLLSTIAEVQPTAINFQTIKPLNDEEVLLFLLPLAWEIFHPNTPYPSYGFFQWINQLIERI